VPPPGAGAISASFQAVEHTGHRLTDGTYIDNGRSRSGALFVEVDYGVTRRLSVSFGIPFVFTRYTDDDPPPPFFPFLPRDACRCWHGAWQDVSATARLNLVDSFDHVLAITPSITVGVPSHAYEYRGEAVAGRRLKQIRFAVDAGRRLDELSRRLSVSGRYAYTVVERVLEVSHNRSQAEIETAWQVAPATSVRGFAEIQRTHGGLRAGSLPGSTLVGPGDIDTPERVAEHDRLLRDNWMHLGAGVTFRIAGQHAFVTYRHFVRGTDPHAGRAVTAGLVWPFRRR
jgi:hypothetical protein